MPFCNTFFVFPAIKFALLVLGSGIRSRGGLPENLKFSCRRTSRVARLRFRSLGHTSGRVFGNLLVLGKLLFQGCVQINQNRFGVGTLLVPLAGIIVVGVQVNHVGYEVTGVESEVFFAHSLRWHLMSARKFPDVLPISSKVSVRNRFSW